MYMYVCVRFLFDLKKLLINFEGMFGGEMVSLQMNFRMYGESYFFAIRLDW